MIHRLVAAGAEGVVPGRTEIGLLTSRTDSLIPVFRTPPHVVFAVERAEVT